MFDGLHLGSKFIIEISLLWNHTVGKLILISVTLLPRPCVGVCQDAGAQSVQLCLRVCQQVLAHIALGGETPATGWAWEGFFSGVAPEVDVQGTAACK